MAVPSEIDISKKPDGVGALRGWLAFRLVRWIVRPTMQAIFLPLMKWCAGYIEVEASIVTRPALPFVEIRDSPINPWLLDAARRYQMDDPNMQRDLNASTELLRGSVGPQLQVMFGHLITKYPPEEAFVRVSANAFYFGYTAGALVQSANAGTPQLDFECTEERQQQKEEA